MDGLVMFAWQTLAAMVAFGLSALVLVLAGWGVVTLVGFIRNEMRYW